MYNLEHFLVAQNKCWETVEKELKNGKKETHWIWYVFPQVKGISRSETAIKYGLNSEEEALAYYKHPILGKRLIEALNLLDQNKSDDLSEMFGFPDDLKLVSCLTLFHISTDNPIFKTLLDKYNYGRLDQFTIQILTKKEKLTIFQKIALFFKNNF